MPSEEQTRQKNGRAAGYSYKEKVSVEPCGQKSYDQCRDPGPDVVCSRDYRGEGHDRESDIRHIVEERAEPAVRDLFSEHKKGEHPDAVQIPGFIIISLFNGMDEGSRACDQER